MKQTLMFLLLLAFVALAAPAALAVPSGPGGFDFESRTVTLNDGTVMPIVGLGAYTASATRSASA